MLFLLQPSLLCWLLGSWIDRPDFRVEWSLNSNKRNLKDLAQVLVKPQGLTKLQVLEELVKALDQEMR